MHTVRVSLFSVVAGHAGKTNHLTYGGGLGHIASVDVGTEFDNLGDYDYVKTLNISARMGFPDGQYFVHILGGFCVSVPRKRTTGASHL